MTVTPNVLSRPILLSLRVSSAVYVFSSLHEMGLMLHVARGCQGRWEEVSLGMFALRTNGLK